MQLPIEPVRGSRKPLNVRDFVVSHLAAIGEDHGSAMHQAYKARLKEIGEANPVVPKARERKGSNDYTIIAYPWTAGKSDISTSHQHIIAASSQQRHSQLPMRIKTRLSNSIYVHIAYRDIHTKALERWPFSSIDGWFANAWKEPWGRIMKWEARRPDWKDGKFTFSHKEVYGFFLPNITSSIELQTNLEKVISWVNNLDNNRI